MKPMTNLQPADLLGTLRVRPLIGDGAMATLLHQSGVPIRTCFESLCLTRPELVCDVHRAYISAGADVIQTNTFSGHRLGLARYGLQAQVEEINRAAVRIAREAAEVARDADVTPRRVFVLGTMGSTADLGTADGLHAHEIDTRDSRWDTHRLRSAPDRTVDTSASGLRALYEEQATALLAEGVDGILLETFPDLDEMLLAIETVRSLTPLPIVANLSPDAIGVTRDGHALDEAFAAMRQAGADVVGLNCRLGLSGILRSYEELALNPRLIYAAVPNGGMLHLVEGDYSFTGSTDYFADILTKLVQRGVSFVGGCCGTTPEHIRALAQRLQSNEGVAASWVDSPTDRQTGRADQTTGPASGISASHLTDAGGYRVTVQPSVTDRDQAEVVRVRGVLATRDARRPRGFDPLHDSLVHRARRQVTVIVELDPPRTLSVSRYLEGARQLTAAGADAITIADNSLGTVRVSNMAIASLLKAEGIEPLVHVTCRDRNLIGQQSHLMGLHVLGIHHILLVTGDPSRFGDLPGATSVYDVSSIELTKMVKRLNEGIAFSGQPLKQPSRFVVGTSFNPHVLHFDKAIDRLRRKLDAGADFVMTQPMFDPRMFERIARATEEFGVPVFVGVMPLTSARNAQFLHNEVPGIHIPEHVLERMNAAPSEAAAAEGLRIAEALIAEALHHFNGIYLITPFLRYELTVQLTEFIRTAEGARRRA
jgi:methionine synthase I (cobalamin-dependent)/5,10-methylenetetrahydrofolate reductase